LIIGFATVTVTYGAPQARMPLFSNSQRLAAGRFFGHIAYASLVATLPAAESADRGEPDPTDPDVE
jgi:hypothetical protein